MGNMGLTIRVNKSFDLREVVDGSTQMEHVENARGREDSSNIADPSYLLSSDTLSTWFA